jgi:ABC-type transport system involved in multi-copper enzyme maturation permease subunit
LIAVLVAASLRRLRAQPARLTVAVIAVLLVGAIEGPRQPGLVGALFAVLLGAGVVGREVSSGALALVFTRPIRRRDYVLAQWMAVSVAAAVASIAAVAVGIGRQGLGDAAGVSASVAGQLLASLGTAAVMVALSSFSRGYADAGLWLVTMGITSMVRLYGMSTSRAWASRVGHDLQSLLMPTIDVEQLRQTVDLPLFAVVSYLSTVATAIAVAVWCLNRRELSYGNAH